MEYGWIKLHRKIVGHWLYRKKPFCQAFAFMDLVRRASHGNTEMSFDSEVIVVARGQFITSQTALSKAWGWSRAKVQRFLKLLVGASMIEQQTSRRNTVITICNYSRYQDCTRREQPGNRSTDEQPSSNHRASAEQHSSTIKNGKNSNNEKNNKEVCVPPRTRSDFDEHFLDPKKGSWWIANPQYVKAGRRPLKKYPDMFLTNSELADVFCQLAAAGVPTDQFRLVFMRVAARLNTYKAQEKNLGAVSVYNWLIGWAKSDVVKELTASCNLERSKVYLSEAKI